ncbi:23S rRNA (guanosine(2251)-2'-O)-methyltransferase RlmB [Catalinimonas niigatensis]|uniref:23S rRNA (guanosine(2251)-2'-O)-methyltransferase RlmB n=1 Tax=Catalinimonas niigatensis TaxID=1397264 RepID=UPI002665BC8C|nr:23S rRNA (guanosine(2251)-2'-O)-methyltransferase RlmB [Catalinimonas niigatensis]WPP51011.1 23S rRNA (guanosine(2251)-2'-O)-methyltransferase RlmB [Catalinimonas niigatensis]
MSISKAEMIFGTRAVIEAIQAGKELDKVLLQKGIRNELTQELVSLLKERQIPFSTVPIEKFNTITRKNHQGTIAFLSAVVYASLDNIINQAYYNGQDPLLIVLDRVTDVRNFGAIARSAECLGAHALLIPSKGSARISGDAVKASAGALHHIPVCREENLKNTIDFLKSSGVRVIACNEKAKVLTHEADMKGPLALLIGAEDDGISPAYLKMADEQVSIPMIGKIASLNVSVATSICLYEVIRQRGLS